MKTIERLRELLAKATPGPLGIDYDNRDGGVDQIVECQSGRTLTVAFGTSDGNEYDLPSLVESRNALPALLALVEAQAAEIEAWREVDVAASAVMKIMRIHGGGALVEEMKEVAMQKKDIVRGARVATDAALRALEGGAR